MKTIIILMSVLFGCYAVEESTYEARDSRTPEGRPQFINAELPDIGSNVIPSKPSFEYITNSYGTTFGNAYGGAQIASAQRNRNTYGISGVSYPHISGQQVGYQYIKNLRPQPAFPVRYPLRNPFTYPFSSYYPGFQSSYYPQYIPQLSYNYGLPYVYPLKK